MPRSDYVYTVQNLDGKLLAGFTVKRELAGWLDSSGYANPTRRGDLVLVNRMQDGRPGTEVQLNPRTLEPVL